MQSDITGESLAYTFSVDEDVWTKVEENSGSVVYGYNDVLGVDGETDPLCQSMTMVEMSGSDFVVLADVNVSITGYLADRETYGEDLGRRLVGSKPGLDDIDNPR